MDKQQVIAAIKKNILSILCGVVALVALGFMFLWVSPRITSTAPGAESVKQRVQARAAKAEEINRLLNQARPDLDPSPRGGSSANLGMFPTNQLIALGRETMEGVKAQADEVLENAENLNRRIPLGWESYEAADQDWPLEGEEQAMARLQYRDEYNRWINAGNAFDPDTGSYPQGTLQASLGATRPPTSKELQAMEPGLDMRIKMQVPLDDAGNPKDAEDFQRKLAEGRIQLAAGVKYDRAQKHKMYVDANSAPGSATSGLTVHPLSASAQPSAVECFNAQVGLWVQETVAENLLRANEEALASLPTEEQNIINAPVKHLLLVAVPILPFGEAKAAAAVTEGGEPVAPPADTSAIRGGGRAAEPTETPTTPTEEAPAEEAPASTVPIDPTAPIDRQYNISPSGRPANTPFYDLVQFRVVLRCDSQSVPYVLKQLQASSFVTVLNVDMTAVEPAVAAQQGYIYGNRPVVQLSLQCEMSFLRQWLVPLMPAALQQGIADRAARAAAAVTEG